jgi:hypothetical protein
MFSQIGRSQIIWFAQTVVLPFLTTFLLSVVFTVWQLKPTTASNSQVAPNSRNDTKATWIHVAGQFIVHWKVIVGIIVLLAIAIGLQFLRMMKPHYASTRKKKSKRSKKNKTQVKLEPGAKAAPPGGGKSIARILEDTPTPEAILGPIHPQVQVLLARDEERKQLKKQAEVKQTPSSPQKKSAKSRDKSQKSKTPSMTGATSPSDAQFGSQTKNKTDKRTKPAKEKTEKKNGTAKKR